MKHIPKDADLLYIGGVLPPNMGGLSSVLNPVNAYWASILPNSLFSQEAMPLFHFCTYSYIISKKCATRLLEYLANSEIKMPQAVDHFLGRQSLYLNTYVATPLITKCFQDDDPNYQMAQFNSGTGCPFDSDIFNNMECQFPTTETRIKLAGAHRGAGSPSR